MPIKQFTKIHRIKTIGSPTIMMMSTSKILLNQTGAQNDFPVLITIQLYRRHRRHQLHRHHRNHHPDQVATVRQNVRVVPNQPIQMIQYPVHSQPVIAHRRIPAHARRLCLKEITK